MAFKAKKIDLTLELELLDGSIKKYDFFGAVNAKSTDLLIAKMQAYENANEAKPENERDSLALTLVKELKFAYPELDIDIVLDNYSIGEIKEIINWIFESLSLLKKSPKS